MSLSPEDLSWFHEKFDKVEKRLTALEVAILTRAAKKGRNNGAYAGLVVSIVPWIIYLIVTLTGHSMPPPAVPTAPAQAPAVHSGQ